MQDKRDDSKPQGAVKQPVKHSVQGHVIWGGRFECPPDDLMVQINASIDVDKRLYEQDITASIVHARMLGLCGIIQELESERIIAGLEQIRQEIESGDFVFEKSLEDIHMNIESRLRVLIGDVAGKLHTARSRNDQVATDFRLWMKEAITALITEIGLCVEVLEKTAQAHESSVMAGFTHLQIAQPVTLALHLRAWCAMLVRDQGRFADTRARLDESPLGACALAGTSFPIDRAYTAQALGFARPVLNTMDAVSARDFVLEFLSACAICGVHLSRFAEEIILWTSTQFAYARLGDDFSTGSSIMPQKKNPDAAELMRGKSGKLSGNLMQMLMVMKGLPLAYNKDMQEDKDSVFNSFDTLILSLRVLRGMFGSIVFDTARMVGDARNGFSVATDLADFLVKTYEIPFREAHHITGQIVKCANVNNTTLEALSLAQMQEIDPRLDARVFSVLDVAYAVKSRGIVSS